MATNPGAFKRRELASKGYALPDGSFPIQDKRDLQKAISAFGLGKNTSAAKAHIIKRARALGATDLLPSKWKVGLKHSEEVDDFLAHYGIKGMHWGVVHDPASAGNRARTTEEKGQARQARRETSAQKIEQKAAAYQEAIDKINSQEHGWFTARGARNQVKDLTKLRDIKLSDAEKKRQGKLTSTQKKVLIGAAVAGGILATVAVAKVAQSGEFNRLAMKGKAALSGKSGVEFAKRDILASKDLNPETAHKLVASAVNPEYGAIGTKVNCRRCTFAYELRRRGYDVSATKTTTGSGQTALGLSKAINRNSGPGLGSQREIKAQMTKEFLRKKNTKHGATPLLDVVQPGFLGGAKEKFMRPTASGIMDRLAKEPNGSRGELGVIWSIGGAHSMAYEIFNGKPVVFDTQSGKKFEAAEDFVAAGFDKISDAGFTRLDNLELNTDFLSRWVKNAK